jgi:hypothetical protein
MIRVTVELISAIDGKRSTLGVMDICNTGNSPNPKRSDYRGFLYKKGTVHKDQFIITNENNIHRRGSVEDFPRQSYVVWRLVLRMLRDMFKDQEK